jgi:hypothetical protein
MKAKVRFLGLDVHAETIAVAVGEPDGQVRSLGAAPQQYWRSQIHGKNPHAKKH